ncbi:hypothetical protein ASG12_01830 [Williamsia sp. Leaf354]|uniref:serine hydrolase domain-containing protein n=1 Tax=Williamsia sp. Leaf354 TaxID=1736349 RepID=UPI0006F823B0|nr:serine hydrolase domain-containing protein [Williamsia sp. Leaf354]KQR99572.1 hypothetical protein ASG12_01830 [Williamsia sp. Leaf354]
MAVLLALCVGTPATASGRPADDVGSRVDTYLDRLVDEQSIPGMGVALIDDEAPPVHHFRGYDGEGRAVDARTPFLIGSVAKSMTAAIVAKQVRAGSLRWSDRVGDHLPWSAAADATTEQLLTHTAGFTAADGLAVSERFDTSPGAIDRAARDLHRSGRPGGYRYSDANYLMLGALIEKVTGRPYADVLRSDLLDPLGMMHTSAASADVRDLPAGHRFWWGQPVRYDPGFDESGAPYGYIASTIDDMALYAQAQMGRAPAVLDATMLADLHQPRVRSGDDRYGFGWRVDDSDGRRVVHHTGATPGYFAHVMLRSDAKGVVILANAYSETRAPALAAVAGDLLAIVDGRQREPGRGDTMLGMLPWVLVVTAGIGFIAMVLAWRRPRHRGVRIACAVASLVVVAAVVMGPRLLGATARQLWIWAPDSAIGVVATAVSWAVLAAILVGQTRLR